MYSLLPRLARLLGSRWGARGCLLLACLLALASLSSERALDDWVLGLVVSGRAEAIGLSRAWYDCFDFTRGDPNENLGLMGRGVMLPWFSDPYLRVAFLRPLSALTHRLDEAVFPGRGAWMHWHSVLWFAGSLLVVKRVYRAWTPSASVFGLALAVFALSSARGATLAWISNRNALVCLVFGGLGLLQYAAFRSSGRLGPGLRALALLAAAWLASDLAVGALAYLVAYACFLDGASARERALALTPFLLLSFGMRAMTLYAGYGVQGSDAYVDPLGEPLKFLAGAPWRWLWLACGQFSPVPSDAGWLLPTQESRGALLLGVPCVGASVWLMVRSARDAVGRFWFWGMLLALLPMAASLPSDRLLSFVSLGASPLLARGILMLRREAYVPSVAVSSALTWLHLVWSPLTFPWRAVQLNQLEGGAGSVPAEFQALSELKDPSPWIVVNAPSFLMGGYLAARLAYEGRPRKVHVLSGSAGEVRVSRPSERVLVVTPEAGFLGTPLENHYRSSARPLDLYERIELSGWQAQVLALSKDGRPQSVAFTFERPLEEYRFVCWTSHGYQACEPPGLKQSRALSGPNLSDWLARQNVAILKRAVGLELPAWEPPVLEQEALQELGTASPETGLVEDRRGVGPGKMPGVLSR